MREFKGYQKGINLGGWLSQCNYTIERYETFITEEDFKRFSKWDIDHVRIPVDYPLLEEEDGTPTSYGMMYLQRAVDWCEKYNLNMILDLHKAAGYFFNNREEQRFFYDDDLRERFYALWMRLAQAFGKYSDRIAFELLNEVTEPKYSKPWNEIANECIRRIRTVAPDTYILVGSYWNNSIDSMKDLDMPYDDKIVYNFHCYDPFLFTHQGASWSWGMPLDFRMNFGATKQEYIEAQKKLGLFDGFMSYAPNEVIDKTFFEWRFERAAKLAEERGVMLYCGEYGVINNADPHETLEWYKAINAAFKKYSIGRACWSYKHMSFGLVDDHMKDVVDELVKYL